VGREVDRSTDLKPHSRRKRLATILADRRASSEGMEEGEAMTLAVHEQHASRHEPDLEVAGADRDVESSDSA
jgi:hypothetical protein